MIIVYYHPGFAAPLGHHKMPIQKFALVAKALQVDPAIHLVEPEPAKLEDLLRVHNTTYIDAVRTGQPRVLAESQKFPWTPELFPSVLLTNGGILAAAHEALRAGSSAALASGFHHSSKNQGEGFCTFNGLIVALDKLKSENKIRNAAILDMDLHYGNGTAQLATTRPWLTALSLYGNDYLENTAYRDVSVLRHQDGVNHKSVALPAGCDGPTQLRILEENLPLLLTPARPDILLYQAGADPYFEDPYSPLSLNFKDLQDRDRRVFKFSRQHNIPIAWVLAGGYTEDISKIVQVHVNTFQAWKEVYLAP
jgi:acetoin utilization deacetylase AcuC-like enzyme